MAIKKAGGGQSYVGVTRAGSSASKPNSTGLQFQRSPGGNESPLYSKASQPPLVLFSEFRQLWQQIKGVVRSRPHGRPSLAGHAQSLAVARVY